MKNRFIIYLIQCMYAVVIVISDEQSAWEDSSDTEPEESDLGNEIDSEDSENSFGEFETGCWMTLNAPHHFETMDEIDDRFAKIRSKVQDSLMNMKFDETMMSGFIRSRGVAIRELYEHQHQAWMIPSGINLGGFCMMRMADSILFFHRMKLRNNTYFRVDTLHNDLSNMIVKINLALNDLHLKGAYERCMTDNSDPSTLIYAPTFGQVEFLLKNVGYKMEGRYRLIKDRLRIELVSSEIIANDVLMTYKSEGIDNSPIRVEKDNLGAFMERMKTDLDKWVKDYFNDVMIRTTLEGVPHIKELANYDKEKKTALEEYVDNALNDIGARIRSLGAENIKLPVFTLKSVGGLQIYLYEGILRGLDSMYRRAIATGLKQRNVRKVDTVIGFSNLKVVYKYEASIPTGVPPLAGVLTFSANELTAHLALNMIKDPEVIDLDIEFLDQMKPEYLTVEGPANTMISNFRHLLEHQIVSIMSNSLIHGIKMLRSLPSCVPFLPGQIPPKKPQIDVTTIRTGFESEYSFESDDNSDALYPRKLKSNVSSSEDKAALRSTRKPQTTMSLKPSNKSEINKNIVKLKNRRKNNKM